MSRQYRQLRFEPPPGATEILLVRHGESEPAVDGRPFRLLEGQGDPSLSPEGRAQAEMVCARLARERVDAIYVSSLRRTAQTAEPLARALSLDPAVDADLREVFVGEWEGGLLRKKMIDRDPVAVARDGGAALGRDPGRGASRIVRSARPRRRREDRRRPR